jgi:hypothetical protein
VVVFDKKRLVSFQRCLGGFDLKQRQQCLRKATQIE